MPRFSSTKLLSSARVGASHHCALAEITPAEAYWGLTIAKMDFIMHEGDYPVTRCRY